MADNFSFTEGSGKTGAADEIGGVLYPRVKIAQGADGSATDVSSAAPLQVSLANHSANATAVKVDGSATTQPVSGTVTANLAAGTNNIGDVDILSIAAGDNNIGNVDVVTLPAIPAGTNNIGDVDVLSVPAPLSTTGGGTEATALRVTVATDSTGVLSVDDNGSTISIDDGAGSLTVDGTVTVTGVSTLAEQQSQTTHLATIAGDTTDIEAAVELIDDAIVADDAAFTPATTKVMMAGFEFDDAAPDSVNEGDAGAARMSANRNIYTTLRDAAGNERGANVNASNQLAVSVDNTVTVASHAVTNAGTFAVQESGSALTALQLIDDVVHTDDTSTHATGTSKGALFMAAAAPTDASVNANDIGAVAMTTDRKLHVSVQDALPAGSNAIGKLAANSGVDIGDVDVTTVGTITPGTAATSLGKAEDAVAGSGDTGVMALAVRADTAAATAANGDYVPLLTDSVGALHTRDTASLVDDAAFTPGSSRVIPIGLQADESSTDSVDEGDAGTPRMTLDRKVIVTPQPHTAGGLTIFRSIDLDETEEEIKASAGQVYGMWVTNTATSTRFIKFYNATAANVTVGSTTPVITIGIPGSSSDDVSGLLASTHGIAFDTAITAAATTGVADADTGAPGANEVIINVFYK